MFVLYKIIIMIKFGIIGFNSIDVSDLQYLVGMEDVHVEGCYIYYEDTDKGYNDIIGNNIKLYTSFVELIKNTDCLVCYYDEHPACFSIISQALKHSRHVFIKNPFAITPVYLKQFIDLAVEADVVIKLDQKNRFNPVFQAIAPYINDPRFIRIEHLEKFNETNAGESVINKKLIADIDMILSILRHDVRKINANGVSVDGYTHDMLNTSIEFNSGCVVNILKSRLSEAYHYKMDIFQKNNTIVLDFNNQKATVTQWANNELGTQRELKNRIPLPENANQHNKALFDFYEAVKNCSPSISAIENFYLAQHLAKNIFEKIKFVTKEV